jgi:cytochrome c oxidase assembly protein subunit 11
MSDLQRRNRRMMLGLVGLVGAMGALSYASVPLYQLFCRVTGYGGTPQIATAAPGVEQVLDRVMNVRFNADVNPALPWQFEPVERQVKVRVGETRLVYYRAQNLGSEPVVGTATFNVTPDKMGVYFSKLQCFCFTEQALAPGESIDMPVSFFIDPAIVRERNMDDVRTVTLSYTFFRAPSQAAASKLAGAPKGAPVN